MRDFLISYDSFIRFGWCHSRHRISVHHILEPHGRAISPEKRFTSEYFTKSKPDPECFLLAMKELGGTPETTFVFEDSVNGLKAARASGGIVMGLLTSNPIDVVKPLSDHTLTDFTLMDYSKLSEVEKFL